MIVIGYPVNETTLNNLEYLSDEKGNEMLFEDEEKARAFLLQKGFSEEDIGYVIFEEKKTQSSVSKKRR